MAAFLYLAGQPLEEITPDGIDSPYRREPLDSQSLKLRFSRFHPLALGIRAHPHPFGVDEIHLFDTDET